MKPSFTLPSLLAHLLAPLERLVTRGQARSQRCWPLIVVGVAVVLAFAGRTPPYHEMAAFPPTPYGQALTWWLDHPFSPVPVDHFFPPSILKEGINAGCASHCDKLTFRVTLPLFNQVLHGGIWTLVAASNLAAILIFYLAYKLVLRDAKDVVSACFTTWALACCYAGRYGFQDYICGDAVAIAFLLGALAARLPWLIGLLVLVAGLTDERALIASPLVALYHIWRQREPSENTQHGLPSSISWRAGLPVGMAWAVYLILRLSFSLSHHAHTGNTELASLGIFMSAYNEAPPVRLADSFAGLWLMPFLFVLYLQATRGWLSVRLWTYVAFMGLAIGPAFLVLDFSRSLCYLLPGIMLAVCLLPFEKTEKRTLLGVALIGSLAWSIPGSAVATLPEQVGSLLHHLLH